MANGCGSSAPVWPGFWAQAAGGWRHARYGMQPVYARLEPGERLRLSLAGAAWPQVAVNPGDGSLPRGGVGPSDRVITLTLELAASRLRLGPLAGAN